MDTYRKYINTWRQNTSVSVIKEIREEVKKIPRINKKMKSITKPLGQAKTGIRVKFIAKCAFTKNQRGCK
jgi:hypothetical protein